MADTGWSFADEPATGPVVDGWSFADATPKPSDATIKPAPERGFWERVKGSILGSPQAGDTPIGRALGYSFEAPSEKHVPTTELPLVRATELTPEITGVAANAVPGAGLLAQTEAGKGVGKGIAQVAEGLTTAPNLLLTAGSGGFGLLGEVNALLPRAVSGVFSVNMLHQAYDQIPAFKQAWESGNPQAIAQVITEMAAPLIMGGASAVHASGAIGDIGRATEAHNVEAAKLVEQERAQPTPITEAPEFVLGGKPIPVDINGEAHEIRPAGMSGSRRPYYDVVNPQTGEVQFGGYGPSVQDWLRSRGATAPGGQPVAPVEGVAPPPLPRSARPAAATPAAPEGWEFADAPEAGSTFEKTSGKFSVTAVENGKVRYDFETPAGTVVKGKSLPLKTFNKMMSTGPVQTGQKESPAPAPPEQEVIQPKPSAEVPEAAGAQEEVAPKDLSGAVSGIAHGITANMYDMLWKKVESGDVTEAGGPSAVLRIAKRIRDAGGLKTQDEFRQYAQDYGNIPQVGNNPAALAQRRSAIGSLISKYSAQEVPSEELPPPQPARVEGSEVQVPALPQSASVGVPGEPTESLAQVLPAGDSNQTSQEGAAPVETPSVSNVDTVVKQAPLEAIKEDEAENPKMDHQRFDEDVTPGDVLDRGHGKETVIASWRTAGPDAPDSVHHITLMGEDGHRFTLTGKETKGIDRFEAKENIVTGEKYPQVETLKYGKGNDRISVFVRDHPGKGWEVEGDFNLQGLAGGYMGNSGHQKFYPTREEALSEFVKNVTKPQTHFTARIPSDSSPKLAQRQAAMVDWVKKLQSVSNVDTPKETKPVTPQVTEPGTKYVLPSVASAPGQRTEGKYPNLDPFMKVYEGKLREAVEKYPDEYRWPVSDVPRVAAQMKKAIIGNSFSHEGKAFKATAKELGIKPTRKAILEYLSKEPEAAAQPKEEATPLAQPEEKTTLEAGNEPAATEPGAVRSADNEPLAEQLPQGSASPGEGEPTPAGSGESRRKRKPRARTSPGEGAELEPSGGTVSGIVGDAAEPERTFPPRAEAVSNADHQHDYRIPDGRVISGSPESRAKTNIEAIKTLRQIQAENRAASKEEQEILAGYVGWGAVPQLFAGSTPEFQKLQDDLKSLLSDEEYSDAQRSTTNAHYTGDNVVDAMWKAVQHLGAKPGMSWLEPAVGVGNFFGRQPQELLQGARRVGLDKDSLSGQIAKLLYPDSGIDVVAYEDAELPKDYFDGAISNVPFGNFGVHDAEFRGKDFLTGSIHNYFFAKSLTNVRPGGLVAFVTSRYTMDAEGAPALKFRKWVADNADFIGAVRLPSGAFRQSSGTEVITDIIFLRRRAKGETPAGDQWVKSIAKQLKAKTDYNYEYNVPHGVNEYYHAHPEMILGTEGVSRGQFSSTDYDVKGKLTQEDLDKALEKLPANLGFQERTAGKASRRVAARELNAPVEQSKLGGLFFDDKGDLYRKTSKGSAEPVDASAPTKKRIKGQLGIRDNLVKLTAAELEGRPDKELDSLRRSLNLSYDAYVKANGPLSSQSNTAVMKGDPDAPLLVSLERRFDKGNKAQGRAPYAEKAPIFTRRMLKPAEAPSSVGDPKEALYIALNEKGRIDFERMGELTGRTPEQLQQDLAGLIYLDPQTRVWQTAEEYLSGSVRNKLKQARAISKVEPQFNGNAEALEKVQPEDIAPGDIRALLGVTWVPIQRYSEFASEMLGSEKPVKVKYAGGNWIIDTGYGNRLNNAAKWSTARAGAAEILSDSLNMRRTKIIDKDSDGNTSVNPDETKSARAKQMEMQDHFEKWLFAEPTRADEVARIYNDTQNDLRLRTFDGTHLTLPGMTKDAAVVRGGDLDPHQKAAVWRQIVQPNVLLAHAVGSGKTFEMIAAGMELQRLGLIRRPMFVVPNATLTGWQNQFAALYPQKRTLVFSEKDLEKSKRQHLMAQIATGDWDAVVVPHSSFQFLPTGDDIFNQHFDKLSDELAEAISEAEAAGLDTRQIKRMEKAKERLLTSLKDKRNAEQKDLTVTWEQLGIDQLFVDESHEYKKLGFSTKQGNVAGIDQQGNQKTFDLLMKMRYTQDHGRGVVHATGTPVTNTMGELFSIMKYLIEKELEARGMGKFDEWSANFGRTVDVFEPKIEGGGYQMKARFAQFVNIPELAQLFRSFADVVTSDMIDIPRPEIVGGKRQAIETQLTEEQEDYLQELRARAKDIREDPKDALPDNMLAVYGDAAKMAMDIRMVRPGAPDDPNGRLNVAADKIYELWEKSTPVKGTQLVMSDLGKPAEAGGSKSFSAYDELINKLVERGIPRNEIAHVYQAKNKSQRARLFQDVNDGKVRVVLGSTMKMGVGVNVQQRLYAMHHLDVPHRPSDLEQREGRILRQGNENPEVHIYYYVTKGSLDEAKFSNVVRKAKFINQVMQGKSEVREAEDVGGMIPSLEMFQAMASGDPRVMQKMETDAEVDRLSGVYSGWKNQQYKIRGQISQIPGRIQWAEKGIENNQRDMAIRDKAGEVWTVGKQKFSGEKISKEVSEVLRKEISKAIDKKLNDAEIGSSFGLPILVSAVPLGAKIEIGDTSSIILSQDEIASADLYRRVKNQVEGLEDQVSSKKLVIEKAKKEQQNLEASLEEHWPYAQKFADLVEKQKQLVKELGADKGDDAAAAVGEGGEISDKSVEAQEVDEPEEEGGEEDEEEAPVQAGQAKAPEHTPAEKEVLRILGRAKVEADSLPDYFGTRNDFSYEEMKAALHSLIRSDDVKHVDINGQRGFQRVIKKSGEHGGAPLDFLSLGVSKLVEKDILPTLANAARGISSARGDILKVLAPAAREGAKETALTIREHAAELARATDRAEAALETARKFFAKEPTQSNLDFIDRVENGQPQPGGYQPIADTMRQILDDRRDQVQALGKGKLEEYYEDYFPHIWKQPDKASDAFKSWFAKRPMEGAKSFLKRRTIPTIKDGIDMGLEPESTNPVDLVLQKVREMDKYIFAHRALNELKEQGILKFVKAGAPRPEGYEKINDNVSIVYGPRTEEGAQAIRGQYYAPEPAATLLNNYLSPGLRKFGSFRAYMGLANILNQFQLGWSAYHLGFTSYDAAVSRVALGIMQAARGNPIKGFVTAASAPIAPFRGIWQGDKVLKEWFKPGTQGHEMGLIVDAMMMAGGRARMDRFYQTSVTKSMMDALRQGNIWGAALRAPFALTEQASRPILEWVVPRQKMAVFADLARMEMERIGDADDSRYREAMAKAWDSVDNRMGQLVYDNLFWNKTIKDAAMASVRSVGWNVGTIRELVGGAADSVKALGDGIKGKPPEVTSRMAYMLALPALSVVIGGIIFYLTTGQRPEEMKDYFFPRRGPKGTTGWNKRMALPSYVKDVLHYSHDPYQTVRGKVHPLLELMMEMMSNEDYFGRHIRNDKDPLVKQMKDMAAHAGEAIEPMAMRPLLAPDKKGQETTAEKVLPFIGITEAPRYVKEGETPSRRR